MTDQAALDAVAERLIDIYHRFASFQQRHAINDDDFTENMDGMVTLAGEIHCICDSWKHQQSCLQELSDAGQDILASIDEIHGMPSSTKGL